MWLRHATTPRSGASKLSGVRAKWLMEFFLPQGHPAFELDDKAKYCEELLRSLGSYEAVATALAPSTRRVSRAFLLEALRRAGEGKREDWEPPVITEPLGGSQVSLKLCRSEKRYVALRRDDGVQRDWNEIIRWWRCLEGVEDV